MISVEQAQKILRDTAHLFCARSSETVLLEEARRRILAQDVHAPCDFPAFDTSTMDGFVFHRDDIAHHHDREKPIPICGEIASGDMPTHFPRGHALKIFTGAAIPYGANCVVPIEQCTVQENRVRITQNLSDIKEQQHIRPKGLNFTQKECDTPWNAIE